jgi:hypothetical protein
VAQKLETITYGNGILKYIKITIKGIVYIFAFFSNHDFFQVLDKIVRIRSRSNIPNYGSKVKFNYSSSGPVTLVVGLCSVPGPDWSLYFFVFLDRDPVPFFS